MELQIDTSTRYAAVGLSVSGSSVVELAWRSEQNHSIELVPAINRALDHAGATVADLRAVFVTSGPGGFSALRVGMSIAKAIASARSIPLVTVGTLDVEIQPFMGAASSVCAAIGAGRNRIYTGTLAPGVVVEPHLRQVDDFLETLAEGVLYCGEAIGELAPSIRDRLGAAATVAETGPPTRRMSALAHLASAKLEAGSTADPGSVEPLYLRSSQVDAAARRWGTTR